MKKCWMILLAVFLTGCSAEPTFETLTDVCDLTVSAPAKQILMELPDSAQVPALQSEGGTLYFCDDMTVCVQTLEGGDLDRTVQALTGYDKDDLQLMASYAPEGKCYECVWTAAGEGQMQVGRARIIDDGSYHYAVTVLMPEETAGQLQSTVQQMLDSFRVLDAAALPNTGS